MLAGKTTDTITGATHTTATITAGIRITATAITIALAGGIVTTGTRAITGIGVITPIATIIGTAVDFDSEKLRQLQFFDHSQSFSICIGLRNYWKANHPSPPSKGGSLGRSLPTSPLKGTVHQRSPRCPPGAFFLRPVHRAGDDQ